MFRWWDTRVALKTILALLVMLAMMAGLLCIYAAIAFAIDWVSKFVSLEVDFPWWAVPALILGIISIVTYSSIYEEEMKKRRRREFEEIRSSARILPKEETNE